MENKYFNGVVVNPNEVEDVDADLKSVAMNTVKLVDESMDTLHVAMPLIIFFDLFL